MSKIKRGNKEAKKPKQARPLVKPLTPGGLVPLMASAAQDRGKKK